MDRETNGQIEFLTILQDLAPYQGRCPKMKVSLTLADHFVDQEMFQAFRKCIV